MCLKLSDRILRKRLRAGRRIRRKYMYILRNDLYQELSSADKILIYGAGNYANIVYPMLKKAGLKDKICLFVVTELKETRNIDGIPIKPVRELATFNVEKYKVLVAVGKEYEQEIIQSLFLYNFVKVLKLTDYILSEDDLIEKLKNQSDEQFLEWAVEEYVWNNMNWISELEDKTNAAKKMIAQREEADVDRNTIIFVLGNLPPRTIKIIQALLRKNYNIVVLEYGDSNNLAMHELVSYNIDFFQCKDIMEVFYKAMQYKPLIYYFDPKWGDCNVSEIMLKHRNLFGKIVFASYDVLNDGYACVSEKQKLSEKYSLENADGIVWRWFSKEFLEETKGFIYKGKSIQFLDYCNGYEIENKERDKCELRLCFVAGGTYGLLDEEIYRNDGHYAELARIDSVMKKIGKRNDCIFHAYIGKVSKEDRKKFDALAREYPNFKIYCGTRYNELIQKISEYDYGCYWSTGGEAIPELEVDGNGFTGSNYINAVPNRYFDYLDAGIPIIAVQPQKLCDYFDKLGVLVKMNISNMDIDYLKDNRQAFRRNVEKAKEKLLIDKHIQRLIDFFEDL